MSFRSKLFLSILATTILTALLVAYALYQGAGSNLQDFIAQQERELLISLAGKLEEDLDANDWQALQADPRRRQGVLHRALIDLANERLGTPRPRHRGDVSPMLRDVGRRLRWQTTSIGDDAKLQTLAVRIDDMPAGVLTLRTRTAWRSLAEQRFRERQRQRLLIALSGCLILSLLIALLLSRALNQPMRELLGRTQRLAGGERSLDWQTRRHDEFGALHQSFAELDERLRQEQDRQRQWLADTAHELRTPLSILRGEIEAMRDGVRDMDDAALRSLHDEVQHLTGLIEALHELSLGESGQLRLQPIPLALNEWLAQQLERHGQALRQAGLEPQFEDCADKLVVAADPDRLQQVLDNLINNSLRYTSSPGALRLRLRPQDDCAVLELADSAPSPPSTQMAHLFDRFFRADAARSSPGTGLGLAIVKTLIEAHGGAVSAERSELGGLLIRLRLPLANSETQP